MITVDGYPFDLVETVQHDLEAEVTDHPVEDGTNVTDNVIIKPRQLTFTNAIVSDTPIGAVAQDASRQQSAVGSIRFSQDAYNRLENTFNAKKQLTVVTGLKKYDHMIMDKLSIPQEAKNKGGLVFTVHFKQIAVAKNNRVTVSAANLLGSQGLGNKSPIVHPAGVTYVRSQGPAQRSIYVPQFGQPVLTTTAAQRAVTNGNQDDGLGTLDHYKVPEGQPIDGYVVDQTAALAAKVPPGKKLPSDLSGHPKNYYRLYNNAHIPGYPSTGVDNTKRNRTGARSGSDANGVYNHVAGAG